MQSSKEKSQNARKMVSGRNKDHIKTEGQFGVTQRSAYTRHSKEDSTEGNGSHTGTCGYDNPLDSDNEKCHSPNLSSSPDLSMQMYDDEAPNIKYRPCNSDKAILYDTSSDSDDKYIINKVTSDHSLSPHPELLTATTPDMSLQMSSRHYQGDSEEGIRYKKTITGGNLPKISCPAPTTHILQRRSVGYTPRKASHINYSTGDSNEDIRYKKITTEDHLPNPRPNRPRAPPAPPPADHLN